MSGQFTNEELERSVAFDRYRCLIGHPWHPAVAALVADLERWEERAGARTRQRRPADAEALKITASCLLANLYSLARHTTGPDLFLAIGFANGAYPLEGRYNSSGVSLSALRAIKAYLEEHRLIDFHPGFLKRDGGRHGSRERSLGRVSRMRAKGALVAWIEARGVSLSSVGSSPDMELVWLRGPTTRRGGPKPLVPYEDTQETRRWRTILGGVNARLSRTDIALSNASADAHVTGQPPEFDEDAHNGDPWQAGDLTAKTLVRIFNDSRWDHGGRLYGGWWERAPKEVRRRITIDGEATVELDYRSLHPRLLYARERLTMPPEPYIVPGLEEVPRDLGKVTFMRLVNRVSGEQLRLRKSERALLPRGCTSERFVAGLVSHHAPIAHHFGTGVGLELQRKDSDIAIGVLNYLVVVCGVPVLPVHDSFIVQSRYRGKLEETMKLSYLGQGGRDDDVELGEA